MLAPTLHGTTTNLQSLGPVFRITHPVFAVGVIGDGLLYGLPCGGMFVAVEGPHFDLLPPFLTGMDSSAIYRDIKAFRNLLWG